MTRHCATLTEAIAFARDRWNDRDCPLRLHDFAIGDDGAPRLAARFVAYLDAQAYSTRDVEETEECYHPRSANPRDIMACPDCDGGTKRVTHTRYLWPMWAALARLGKVPPTLPDQPAPVLVVVTLAHYRWDWRRTAQVLRLDWHHDGGEAVILSALRRLADRYSDGPLPAVRWTAKSEAQQTAELAASA